MLVDVLRLRMALIALSLCQCGAFVTPPARLNTPPISQQVAHHLSVAPGVNGHRRNYGHSRAIAPVMRTNPIVRGANTLYTKSYAKVYLTLNALDRLVVKLAVRAGNHAAALVSLLANTPARSWGNSP